MREILVLLAMLGALALSFYLALHEYLRTDSILVAFGTYICVCFVLVYLVGAASDIFK